MCKWKNLLLNLSDNFEPSFFWGDFMRFFYFLAKFISFFAYLFQFLN